MEQNCDNCAWKKAPCENCNCKTFRDNTGLSSVGCNDYWTPARPWEEKWIVPEGCEILNQDGNYYIGTIPGEHDWSPFRAAKWDRRRGHCFVGHNLENEYFLKLKTPLIEESEEYKAFCVWVENTCADNNFKMEKFEALRKIFKMELKCQTQPQKK